MIKTPISYYGGKQTLLKYILPLIPNHTIYTEAFCGGCAVLFAKEPVECEVINDTNEQLINFYRVAQSDYGALKIRIDATLHSRDCHAEARHIYNYPAFYTSVDRAWALWTCSKLSFASMLDSTFGYDYGGATAKKVANAKDAFTTAICERLRGVTIEDEDGLHVIARYDRPDTFHFIDPPCVGSDCGHYSGTFSEDDFARLLDLLVGIRGKFMLTMFPHPLLEQYATNNGWTIHRVERTISASKTSRRRQEEWMVCNYEICK